MNTATIEKTLDVQADQDWTNYVPKPGEQPPDEAVGAALASFTAVKDELNATVLARADLITVSLVGLLTGEHVLQLGAPGTAKSMLMNEIARRVVDSSTGQGLSVFNRLMDKFVTVEDLMGPIDVASLKLGKYVRLYEGTFATADLVFLDEVFKSSTAILNALLMAINERMADIGTNQRIHLPLITMFLASNEGPSDIDALLAFYDRILFRVQVQYLERDDFLTMLQSRMAVARHKMFRQHGHWYVAQGGEQGDLPGDFLPGATITRNQLYTLQQAVNFVAVPPHVLDALARIRQELANKGMTPSDRRWSQLVPTLQAHALLRESPVVEDDDLIIMKHALWNKVDEITEIVKQIRRASNPQSAKVQEVFDQAQAAYVSYQAAFKKAANEQERVSCTADMLTTLRNIRTDLTNLRDQLVAQKQEPAVTKAETAIAKVKSWVVEVSSQLANV